MKNKQKPKPDPHAGAIDAELLRIKILSSAFDRCIEESDDATVVVTALLDRALAWTRSANNVLNGDDSLEAACFTLIRELTHFPGDEKEGALQ